MHIITDSSSLITPDEGAKMGVTVVPACTIINQQVYQDYTDITSEAFLKKIEEGAVPTSSQPSIGDVAQVYEALQEEALVLPIGDGLSGTYQNMESAKAIAKTHVNIEVMDTKTLAGPLWYLVRKAVQLRDAGLGMDAIRHALRKCADTSLSFVIPMDFNFLRRSGRLTPVAAKLGTLLKIAPILTQTADKKRITLHAVKRTRKKAVADLIEHLKQWGVNEKHLICVSYAGIKDEAAAVLEQLKKQFSQSVIKLFSLPPALICHGGPGCILIQTIMM